MANREVLSLGANDSADGPAAADASEKFLRSALLDRKCRSAGVWRGDQRSLSLDLSGDSQTISEPESAAELAAEVVLVVHGFWHLKNRFQMLDCSGDDAARERAMGALSSVLTNLAVSEIEVHCDEGFLAIHFGQLTLLALDCDPREPGSDNSFSIMFRRRVLIAEAPGRWHWRVF